MWTCSYARLIKKLHREWVGEPTYDPKPTILEVEDGPSLQVYVVWEEWRGVEAGQRSEVISEAFMKTGRLEDLERFVLAVGYTPEEADKDRIQWRGP